MYATLFSWITGISALVMILIGIKKKDSNLLVFSIIFSLLSSISVTLSALFFMFVILYIISNYRVIKLREKTKAMKLSILFISLLVFSYILIDHANSPFAEPHGEKNAVIIATAYDLANYNIFSRRYNVLDPEKAPMGEVLKRLWITEYILAWYFKHVPLSNLEFVTRLFYLITGILALLCVYLFYRGTHTTFALLIILGLAVNPVWLFLYHITADDQWIIPFYFLSIDFSSF